MTAQLQTLLRLRQYDVDRCQSQLAAAVMREQRLADGLQSLERQQEQQRAELAILSRDNRLNIDACRLRQSHLRFLADQRAILQVEFDAAAAETIQYRNTLVAADQQRQVVEKLRTRYAQAARTQQLRVEGRELEEAWQPKS